MSTDKHSMHTKTQGALIWKRFLSQSIRRCCAPTKSASGPSFGAFVGPGEATGLHLKDNGYPTADNSKCRARSQITAYRALDMKTRGTISSQQSRTSKYLHRFGAFCNARVLLYAKEEWARSCILRRFYCYVSPFFPYSSLSIDSQGT
jgi:hypothetical protein